MTIRSITGSDIIRIGYKQGTTIGLALRAAKAAQAAGSTSEAIEASLAKVLFAPADHVADSIFGDLAAVLVQQNAAPRAATGPAPRTEPAPNKIWGQHDEVDEMPGAYKNIRDVMEAMTDLVEVVGQFDPKIVKMSDDGTNED